MFVNVREGFVFLITFGLAYQEALKTTSAISAEACAIEDAARRAQRAFNSYAMTHFRTASDVYNMAYAEIDTVFSAGKPPVTASFCELVGFWTRWS